MSEEFLKWFLAQKPFRKFRLAAKGGIEHCIDTLEELDIDVGGKTFRLYNIGRAGLRMYRGTYNLGDIEEIRQ